MPVLTINTVFGEPKELTWSPLRVVHQGNWNQENENPEYQMFGETRESKHCHQW